MDTQSRLRGRRQSSSLPGTDRGMWMNGGGRRRRWRRVYRVAVVCAMLTGP